MNRGLADECKHLMIALDRFIANAPPHTLPTLVMALSAKLTLAAARCLEFRNDLPHAVPTRDGNLSAHEAAVRLGVSKSYLYRHASRLPFARKIGRRVLFSANGLERWIRSQKTC